MLESKLAFGRIRLLLIVCILHFTLYTLHFTFYISLQNAFWGIKV